MAIKSTLRLQQRYTLLKITTMIFILADITATTSRIIETDRPLLMSVLLLIRVLYVGSLTLFRQEHITGKYSMKFKEQNKTYLADVVEDEKDDRYLKINIVDLNTNLLVHSIETIKPNVLSKTNYLSKIGFLKTELKRNEDSQLPEEIEGLLCMEWDRKSLHRKVTNIKGTLLQEGLIKTSVEMYRA